MGSDPQSYLDHLYETGMVDAHRAFEELFGEQMIGKSFAQKVVMAKQIMAAMIEERKKLEARVKALSQSKRYDMAAWLAHPAFDTFCQLKHGVVGQVLTALQDGEISRGRAAECLAEIAHGATEVSLPESSGIFDEEELPAESFSRVRSEYGNLRELIASALKDISEVLA